MKKYGKKTLLFILFVAALVLIQLLGGDSLTFRNIQKNKEILHQLVIENYALALIGFLGTFLSVALILPGALVLIVAGGFFFGTGMGILYSNVGATLGATLAFLSSRYLIGAPLQSRYRIQLTAFNEEIEKHGFHYLLMLRVVPALPFFLVNYLAGMTKISLKKFILATSIGILPISIIFTFGGQQLGMINKMEDLFSLKLLVGLFMLAFVVFLPLVVNYIKNLRKAV